MERKGVERQQREIIDSLKRILKQRKITYKKLAASAGIPESTLKKIFAGSSCAFDKILAICSGVNMSLKDVIEFGEADKKADIYSFSKEQEEFFTDNFEYYIFFLDFAFHGKSCQEIQKEYSLSDRVANGFLRKFEELGLGERLPNNEMKWLIPKTLHMDPSGPLDRKINEELLIEFSQHVIARSGTEEVFNEYGMVRGSQETYEEFKSAMKSLYDEFAKKIGRDRRLLPLEKLKVITFWFGVGEYRPKFENIKDHLRSM